MAVGVPTVKLIALKPFLSPIWIKELFFIFFFPSLSSIKNKCCMAIKSVSPSLRLNFGSNNFTRFYKLFFVGSWIFITKKAYFLIFTQKTKVFQSPENLLKHLCFLLVLEDFILFYINHTAILNFLLKVFSMLWLEQFLYMFEPICALDWNLLCHSNLLHRIYDHAESFVAESAAENLLGVF